MSTVQEIEAAIDRLPVAEREAFEARLIARRYVLDARASGEYRELLSSLEEAEQEIEDGRGITAEELRQKLSAWAAK